MGVLIEGEWVDGELPQEIASSGAFERTDSRFRDRITTDGSSGFKAERGRYHLYVAHGCPWAHRALIYLAAKELESVISVAYAIPGLRERGWTFERDDRYPDCLPDDVNGFRHLYEAYVASDPAYTGKVTVPTLWDRKRKRIVNNESSEIIRMFNVEFNAVTGERTDFYPSALRAEIDAVNERVYRTVNNGVYRAGFATSQSAYDEAYDGLFDTLDWLEARLSRQRYLIGGQVKKCTISLCNSDQALPISRRANAGAMRFANVRPIRSLTRPVMRNETRPVILAAKFRTAVSRRSGYQAGA
jgi:glutathionyl-hydroquinone reductase